MCLIGNDTYIVSVQFQHGNREKMFPNEEEVCHWCYRLSNVLPSILILMSLLLLLPVENYHSSAVTNVHLSS